MQSSQSQRCLWQEGAGCTNVLFCFVLIRGQFVSFFFSLKMDSVP